MITSKTHSAACWYILALMFFLHVFTATAMFGFQIMLPQIKATLVLNHAQIGTLMSSYFLGISLVSPVSGIFTDRFGARRSLMLGSVLIGVSFVLASQVPVFILMFPLLLLAGTGHSLITPSTNKAVMLWFTSRLRATAMGVKQTGINGGGLLASLLVPVLTVSLDWPGALATVGTIPILATLLVLIFYSDPNRDSDSTHIPPDWRRSIRELLRNRNIPLLALEGFFRVGIQMAFLTYLALYLQRQLHLSLTLTAILYSTVQGFGAGGRIVIGAVSDHFFDGRRRQTYSIAAIVAAVAFLGFAVFAPATPLWCIFILLAVLGFTAVGHQGVGLALVSESAGADATGLASGFCQFFFFLGVVVISPLLGLMIDMTGHFLYGWLTLALMSFICSFILMFVREIRQSENL